MCGSTMEKGARSAVGPRALRVRGRAVRKSWLFASIGAVGEGAGDAERRLRERALFPSARGKDQEWNHGARRALPRALGARQPRAHRARARALPRSRRGEVSPRARRRYGKTSRSRSPTRIAVRSSSSRASGGEPAASREIVGISAFAPLFEQRCTPSNLTQRPAPVKSCAGRGWCHRGAHAT